MLQLGNKITVGEPIYKFQNNHSVDFDGVDDFIQLGEPISYTQHTISTWVKVTNSGSSKTIIDARDGNDDGIRIFSSSAEVLTYQLNTSDITSGSALSVDEWHHIVATYDGTTQKLYIDGLLVDSATTTQEVSVTTNAKIGARNFDDRAVEFLGKIDELAIYDRALTAAEVTEIYRIKYGANLVQNGRFDELGSELVTNGDFATDSDWSLTNASISNGKVIVNSTSPVFITQSNVATVGKIYKAVITVSDYVEGALRLRYPFTVGESNFTGNGTYVFYGTATDSRFELQGRFSDQTYNYKIDNVSVKQVDPNDRWTLGTGWSITNGKLVGDGTNTGFENAQQNSLTVVGKTYKVTLTIEATSGQVELKGSNVYSRVDTLGVGTHTLTFVADATYFRFLAHAGATITIENVMVEEQKYVATNLKLNSGNYKSADPVIVSTKSVDFDGSDVYLEVTKKDFLGESDFTISMWIKPDTVTADNYFIGQSTDEDNRWYIRVRGSSSQIQFFSKNSGNQVISVLGGTPIANQWNHIVISADRDNNCKLYVNSVLSHTQAAATTASLTFTGNLRIGSFELFGVYFDGTIDDVGIFNVALTSDQVIEIYNQGVPSNLTTSSAGADGALTGYWKMGDGTLDEAPLIADQTNATLGSELITNGDFATDSDWNKGTGWTISGGVASFNTTTNGNINQSGYATNKTYKVSIDVVSYVRGNPFIAIGQGSQFAIPTSVGTHIIYVNSGSTDTILRIYSGQFGAGGEGSIDNVSVKQVNGNPALMINTPTIVTDAPLTKIRNYYRMGDGILDKFPYINDMISPNLAEITSTNLVTHSTDLDSSFAKSNVTLESNAIISPDGTQNASYVKATSSTTVHLISDVVGTNDVIAMSIHAKQGGYTKFRFNSGSSSNGFASFNIATGTVVNTGGTYFYNADIEDVGDGWFRCKMVLIGSSGTAFTVAIEDDAGQVSYTGDTSKGIYFWGAQGEVQRQVTPLITTTGSTVTRTATIENNYGSMISMSESDITNDVPS